MNYACTATNSRRTSNNEIGMITLYQFGNSVCCQKVRITLREKRLEWASVEINLFKNEQYAPAYLKLNPSGVVPTLIIDERVIIESTLICEFLDDTFKDFPLMPEDALGRATVRQWSKMVDEGLHEGVGEISFSAMFRERMKGMSAEARRVRFENVGDPRRRDRFMSTFEHGAHSPWVRYGVAAFEKAFRRLEATLSDRGPWIMGDAPTLADVNLMPYVARLHFLGLLDLWIDKRPRVQAWWELVQRWPSYQAGLATPMLDKEITEMATHGPSVRNDIKSLLP